MMGCIICNSTHAYLTYVSSTQYTYNKSNVINFTLVDIFQSY